MIFGRWTTVGSLLMAAALAACSGSEGPQGPGPMLADNACVQLRADLNAMDKRGVPGLVDSRNSGKKLSPQQDSEASRYNQVLDQYLGGQCASEQRYKAKAGIPQTPPSASGRQASAYQGSALSTGSIPKTQVKRRKPITDDDDTVPAEKPAAATDEQAPSKPAKRTNSSTPKPAKPQASAAKATAAPVAATANAPTVPAPSPVKTESGLPVAPAPDTAANSEKKE